MKHNLTLYKDISRQLTACCYYGLMFIAILSIYHSNCLKPVYFVGIPVILAVFMFIERYCYNIVLYVILHGLCFLPFVIFHDMDIYYRVLYLVMLGAESIRALYIWAKGNDKPYNDVPWPLLIVATICYITAHFYNLPVLKAGAYYTGILTLIIHFIRFYITGLNNLVTRSERVTSIPTKRIMSTNLWLFGFFIIAFIILSACNRIFGFEQIFFSLGKILVKLIRIILKIIAVIVGIIRALTAKNTTLDAVEMPVKELEQAVSEAAEPSLISEFFHVMFVVCFALLLLIITYRVMSEAIKKYLSRYAKDTDIITPASRESGTVKRIKQPSRFRSGLKRFFAKTYNEKIREVYRLKILSYKKFEPEASDTATEIAQGIKDNYGDNIDKLTAIYEKARYSNEQVKADEAKEGGIIC